MSLSAGFSFIDNLSWDYFKESKDLPEQIKKYKERFGYYPESVHADKIYQTRENREYCKERIIRITGKPTDNCHIESFNGTFRYECLNSNYFETISSARRIIENWRKEYNEERPQKRLKGMTPSQYEDMLNRLKTNPTNGRKVG